MESRSPNPDSIPVELNDGSIAELRPILPDDRGRLVEGLEHMSVESRFARFGSGLAGLTEGELDYLTHLDQVAHVAWGASIDDSPAGVARYVKTSDGSAEMALAVVDEFQRRGLGTVLFQALVASARANGLERLEFSVQPFNEPVREILDGADLVFEEHDGLVEGSVDLSSLPVSELDEQFAELLGRHQADQPSSTASRSRDAELMQ